MRRCRRDVPWVNPGTMLRKKKQSASDFFPRGRSLVSEFLPQRRADKSAEQRMRAVRTRTVFRMELCCQEPGMILELDDFDQLAIRRQPAQHQSLCRQLFSVGVIELEAVPVSFANFIHSIHLMSERALHEAAEIASQSHGPAFVADALLFVHQVNDRMG